MKKDHELLLYIAAKIARIDAIVSATHAVIYKDLAPDGVVLAEKREWTIRRLYSQNMEAQREYLKTQFPEDYKALDEHLSLGEAEMEDAALSGFRDILEGRVDIPEAFRERQEEGGQRDS